ncbi:MAG: hypothetical protein PVH82_09975 [Desulfobacteraceae bacterium]|jgi:hypothetical protein
MEIKRIGVLECWPALARRHLNRLKTLLFTHIWLFHQPIYANQVWVRECWV